MTLAEIQAAWQRYMHRADLSADMATVTEFASAKVVGSLMYLPDPSVPLTLDDLTDAMPRMWLHAGLCYLHDLAMDDEGLMREEALFRQASQDHHLLRSQVEVSPRATPAYLT